MSLREITNYHAADMINLDVPEKNARSLSHMPTIEQEEIEFPKTRNQAFI